MAKKKSNRRKAIPDEVCRRIEKEVQQFNRENLGGEVRYLARFKGAYLYLDREDYGRVGPICRLKYIGDFQNWEFAIFKFSSETYDPDECFFPGYEDVDGTIEGAMHAGLKAYPG
jgi:hypothetical protein